MRTLEVIARLKIRPGKLEAFKSQVDEILRSTRAKDTHTLRCDFFVNADGTDCEVHEAFPDEQGLIEHKMNTMESSRSSRALQRRLPSQAAPAISRSSPA
jgi:quinol monooxygenase YgiN